MAKGISIHIGLNKVNPVHYGGWDGQLAGCINDAQDMQALAKKRKFVTSTLIDEQATAAAVMAAIGAAAKTLKRGDSLFLTYSGHGGQVPDRNDEEGDKQDETWCMFDRQLVDDELYALWSRFAKGVRILMLSDSCHSGTVSKSPGFGAILASLPLGGGVRLMPDEAVESTYAQNKKLYDDIQKALPAGDKAVIKATIVLISGCQDNQLSSDGDGNGLFTATLKKVWNGGKFKGSLRVFAKSITAQMPLFQSPNYFVIGAKNETFESGKPFAI